MSDIVQKLRQSYHLDTVQPEHPVLRAVREIERLRESEQRFMQLAAEARRDADALRRDGACPHIRSTADGTHHCALATAPRFTNTYCSQCGSDLGPGDSGVSHCADHRKAALAAAPQPDQEPVREWASIPGTNVRVPLRKTIHAQSTPQPAPDALREAAQQALEALEWHLEKGAWGADIEGVTAALRAALAEPQSTHSADCYQWHHDCAVAEVERLRAAIAKAIQARDKK